MSNGISRGMFVAGIIIAILASTVAASAFTLLHTGGVGPQGIQGIQGEKGDSAHSHD